MHVLFVILLILHFVGIGSLLGGFMTQMKQLKSGTATMNPAMLHGSLTMLVTGVLMVVLALVGDTDINLIKMVMKVAITLAIFALIIIYRSKDRVPSGIMGLVGALTVANIAIAVAWS